MATVYCLRRGMLGKQLLPMDYEEAVQLLAEKKIRKIGHNLFSEEVTPPFVREVPTYAKPAYLTSDLQPMRRGPGRPRKARS